MAALLRAGQAKSGTAVQKLINILHSVVCCATTYSPHSCFISLPGVKLRPLYPDHRAVAGQRMAGVDDAGSGTTGPALCLLLQCPVHQLIGGGSDGCQQLEQMGASFGTAHPGPDLADPARADVEPDQLSHIAGHLPADMERGLLGDGFYIMYLKVQIQGDAYVHIVYRFPRLYPSAPVTVGEAVGLDITQVRFDIP